MATKKDIIRVQDSRMKWYFDHKKELERDHAGEWVAIGPQGLLAWGTDLTKMKEEAQRKGVLQPLFAPITAKEFQDAIFIRNVWRRCR